MGVEILAKKCCLEKGVFDKKCFFLEKDLSDPSDNWHAGPQDSLGKRNLNKLGPFKNGLLQATQKKNKFRYSSHYKVKPSSVRILNGLDFFAEAFSNIFFAKNFEKEYISQIVHFTRKYTILKTVSDRFRSNKQDSTLEKIMKLAIGTPAEKKNPNPIVKPAKR